MPACSTRGQKRDQSKQKFDGKKYKIEGIGTEDSDSVNI